MNTDKILDALRPIAERLSTTAEYLLTKWVVYTVATSVTELVVYIIAVAVCGKLLKHVFDWTLKPGRDDVAWFGAIVSCVAYIILCGAIAVRLPATIAAIAAPEIVLVKEVLKAL